MYTEFFPLDITNADRPGTISKYIQDVSVLRRLLFAVVHFPSDFLNLWRVTVEFATKSHKAV